jgi:hypothetical protein
MPLRYPVLVGGVLFFRRLSPNWLAWNLELPTPDTIAREEGKTSIVHLCLALRFLCRIAETTRAPHLLLSAVARKYSVISPIAPPAGKHGLFRIRTDIVPGHAEGYAEQRDASLVETTQNYKYSISRVKKNCARARALLASKIQIRF